MHHRRRTAHTHTAINQIASSHTANSHPNKGHRPTSLPANILTAQEFIGQGTSAAQVLSIAKYIEVKDEIARARQTLVRQIRDIAFEVAAITGEPLRLARRQPAFKRRAVNDNRTMRYGGRAAA